MTSGLAMPKIQNRNRPTRPADAYSITSVIQAMIIMAEMASAARVLVATERGASHTATPAPRQASAWIRRVVELRSLTGATTTRGWAAESMAATLLSLTDRWAASSLRGLP